MSIPHSYSAWLFTLPAVPLALARAGRSRPHRPVPYPYKTFTTYYLYYHTTTRFELKLDAVGDTSRKLVKGIRAKYMRVISIQAIRSVSAACGPPLAPAAAPVAAVAVAAQEEELEEQEQQEEQDRVEQERGEVVSMAKGLQLHMSDQNATGYKHVYKKPVREGRMGDGYRAHLKDKQHGYTNLGDNFASPVDAAVAVAQCLKMQRKRAKSTQQPEAVEAVEEEPSEDGDSQPKFASELRTGNTGGGQERRELAPEAEVHQLHMSDYGATGYKGVYKQGSRFQARISYGNGPQHLGSFDTALEAAKAYARAAALQQGKEGTLASEEEDDDEDDEEHEKEDEKEEVQGELVANELRQTGLVLETRTRNHSGYLGVEFRGEDRGVPWMARIYEQGCPAKALGNFETRFEAAVAVAKYKQHGREDDQGSDAWHRKCQSTWDCHRNKSRAAQEARAEVLPTMLRGEPLYLSSVAASGYACVIARKRKRKHVDGYRVHEIIEQNEPPPCTMVISCSSHMRLATFTLTGGVRGPGAEEEEQGVPGKDRGSLLVRHGPFYKQLQEPAERCAVHDWQPAPRCQLNISAS